MKWVLLLLGLTSKLGFFDTQIRVAWIKLAMQNNRKGHFVINVPPPFIMAFRPKDFQSLVWNSNTIEVVNHFAMNRLTWIRIKLTSSRLRMLPVNYLIHLTFQISNQVKLIFHYAPKNVTFWMAHNYFSAINIFLNAGQICFFKYY